MLEQNDFDLDIWFCGSSLQYLNHLRISRSKFKVTRRRRPFRL